MLGYLGVSIIHQTLTWTTGSLMCVFCSFCMCMHSVSSKGLYHRICTEFDWRNPRMSSKHSTYRSPILLVTTLAHAQLCFQEQALKQSCSAPPTLPVMGQISLTISWGTMSLYYLEMFLQAVSLTFERIQNVFFLSHVIDWVSEWNMWMHVWSW